jgi:hypothetical protein
MFGNVSRREVSSVMGLHFARFLPRGYFDKHGNMDRTP